MGSVPSTTNMEAVYRRVLHVLDGIKCGYTNITVRANDSDIVVIIVAFSPLFLENAICNLCLNIDFGVGPKEKRVLFSVNKTAHNFEMQHCRGLLFFTPIAGVIIHLASLK